MKIEKKQPTKAWLKAQAKREFFNAGRLCIKANDLSSVVFVYENYRGQPCAIAYTGRATKPRFNYRYKDKETRAQKIKAWMIRISENANTRRKPQKRELEVDDILMAMWGYEQTNIDYFKVTKLVGKCSVELVEIGMQSVDTEYMQGDCVPDDNKIVGEPFIRRVSGVSVKVDNVRYASKKNYKEVAGVRIYNNDHWTSYA